MSVRSGALNLLHKNSVKEQIADIEKAMKHGDVLSLSEVNHPEEIRKWAEAHGYGYVGSKGKGDTGILYDASRFEVSKHGSHTLNQTEGAKGGLRSREAAYALLKDKQTGKQFWQISAHTVPPGHGGAKVTDKIRQEQFHALSKLSERLHGSGHPVLLAGDLTHPGGAAVKGFEGYTSNGPMHTYGMGASTVGQDRIGNGQLNTDHGAQFGEYRLDGGGNDRVNLDQGHGHHGNGGGNNDPKDPAHGNGHIGKDIRDLAMDYGWATSVLHEFPELLDVFKQAVKHSWSVQRFQAEVQDTKWFKKHSDTWRTNMYLQLTDPQTYQSRVGQVERGLADAAGSMGIEFKNNRQLKEMAEQAFLHGWDQTKINNVLARMVDITGKHSTGVGGDLASIQEQLNGLALDNGLKISNKTMERWLRQVVRGDSTMEEFKGYIQKQAAAMFPNWAKEIEAGRTVAQIADPYRQRMADLLEINPEDINLNGKLMRQALSSKNDKGEYDSMSLSDFEDLVRQDHRWQYTDNAREEMSQITAGLLQTFGLIA